MGLRGWLERRRCEGVPIEMPQGRRGTHLFPEVGLPDDFEPPSASLMRCGTYLDPRQLPKTLMEPATEPGQPKRSQVASG